MGCGTIAGLALSLAGAGANEAVNVQTKNSENSLVNNELAKQSQFQNQARNVVANNLSNSTPQAAQQQQQQGAQQFLGASQQAKLPPLSIPTTDQTQSNAVSAAGQGALNTLNQNANAQQQGY